MQFDRAETWLSATQVKARYGITDSTLDRWLARRDFPQPTKYVGQRRYWSSVDLSAWDVITSKKTEAA
jgi:predicted DNA-binding transcriptional regulator AlpA